MGGRLAPVTLPQPAPADAPGLFSNPFWLRDQPGLTQSSGWLDAWRSAPSAYVVRAQGAADVSAAVRFAAAHRLRLVVKGAGHSYLGGSNAPDSLLVWTRDMEAITLHDAFTPVGSDAPPVPAVSLGAGCIWGHVYEAVSTKGGRYVQGGMHDGRRRGPGAGRRLWQLLQALRPGGGQPAGGGGGHGRRRDPHRQRRPGARPVLGLEGRRRRDLRRAHPPDAEDPRFALDLRLRSRVEGAGDTLQLRIGR